MKFFIFFSAIILVPVFGFAQCPPPELLSWHFSDSGTLEISFDAPASVSGYEITVKGRYNDTGSISTTSATFEGDAAVGFNAVEVNALLALPVFMSADTYFYEVLLRTSCASGEWSAERQFYASPFSLRNDGAFICDMPFTTIQYLADGAGFLYETTFFVPPGSAPAQIEDVGILVEVGHNYNGDLAIGLTSPQGTEVSLLPFPNGMGGTSGLSLYFTDDAIPYTGPYPQQGFVQPESPLAALAGELSHGAWTLTIEDNLAIDNGFVFGGCLNINTTPCVSSVSGNAWIDLDEDGEQGPSEIPFGNRPILKNPGETYFFTTSAGSYQRCLDEGPATLSLQEVPQYFESIPEEHSLMIETGEELVDIDFQIQPGPNQNELSADVFSYNPDRPGFSNFYIIEGRNEGNTCVDNIEIEIALDDRLSITEVNADSYSLDGNVVTVEVGNLCPFENYSFSVHHLLGDTVSLGSMLESTAIISPIEGDALPDNNSYTYHSTVVGAYDPNDKQVSDTIISPSFIAEEKMLIYHVRFQNTGTYYAERVVIADTIDTDLDLSSFQLIAHSHDVEITNDGNVLYFTFDNIMLPDSGSNEPESHGYLRYKIRPRATFSANGVIDNTAYIYFDFNEPIITNTVRTILSEPTGILEVAYDATVHPNPVRDQITLAWAPELSVDRMVIYDLAGRVVKVMPIGHGISSVIEDVTMLAGGVYVIQLEGETEIKPLKIVKQ